MTTTALRIAALLALLLVACETTAVPDADAGIADADGDSISDAHEGRALRLDTDGDGALDCDDGDSDGDGVPDVLEAGDADPMTPPRDSDGDGAADFRDTGGSLGALCIYNGLDGKLITSFDAPAAKVAVETKK